MRMANKFDENGLFKKANKIDYIIQRFNSRESFKNNDEKNAFLKKASISIANELDEAGLTKEADMLDEVISLTFEKPALSKFDIAKLATQLDENGLYDIADILDSWASRP